MKSGIFWDVTPCGFVITDVSEVLSESFMRVTRIGELGVMLSPSPNSPLYPQF
jgi:hypothetical protein